MQMAGSEWRNVLGPRCRSLPSSPTSAYPSRFRTPWKTVENAYQTVCTTTKPSRRRFHRVYRPRNTSPIFFSPPPPHRGKSDSGGAFAVFPSARISNRVSLLRACVRVCVRHRRTRSHLSAREEHGGASRDISLRPKKGSRSHRERQRERERGRDPHRRVKDLLLLLRCHLVPVHNGPGRLLSDCLATFFFPQRRVGGSVRDEKGRGRERVKPSRSIAN